MEEIEEARKEKAASKKHIPKIDLSEVQVSLVKETTFPASPDTRESQLFLNEERSSRETGMQSPPIG